LALVLPISKRRQGDNVFFDEQGRKVKRSSLKTVHTIFYQEFVTYYPIAKPAKRFSKSCWKLKIS